MPQEKDPSAKERSQNPKQITPFLTVRNKVVTVLHNIIDFTLMAFGGFLEEGLIWILILENCFVQKKRLSFLCITLKQWDFFHFKEELYF